MLKNNKWNLIFSSIVILLPAIIGPIITKNVSAVLLSVILFILQWLCLLLTDKFQKEQNQKVQRMVIWIMPIVSLLCNGIAYLAYTGKPFNVMLLMCILFGFLFMVIGNYLPKCKQNFTIGIKITWTLASEENWNATHRFGGKVWFVGGLLMLLCCVLPTKPLIIVMTIVLLAMIVVPTIYSYLYYRKQVAAGEAPQKPVVEMEPGLKKFGKISMAITAIILIGCFALATTGKAKVTYDEQSLTISSTYWGEKELKYTDIDSIEYREDYKVGSRTYGFGGAKLLAGTFQNDEFGSYTLYGNTSCDSYIVIETGGKIIAFNEIDESATKKLYEELITKID